MLAYGVGTLGGWQRGRCAERDTTACLQVARHSANKTEALREVHSVSRQLVAAFTEDALPHLLAAECAKEAGMEYCIYGR